MITNRLYLYLKDYYGWATGTPEQVASGPYCRAYGLCYNVQRYIDLVARPTGRNSKLRTTLYRSLTKDLQDTFCNDGLDEFYPFGEEDYERRYEQSTQYQCPIRQEWLKKQLDLYEAVHLQAQS